MGVLVQGSLCLCLFDSTSACVFVFCFQSALLSVSGPLCVRVTAEFLLAVVFSALRLHPVLSAAAAVAVFYLVLF